MDTVKAKAAIEAVLFAEGDAVPAERIAAALEMEREETEALLREMEERYLSEDRGICLIELDGAWQLCTKNEYYDVLIRLEITAKKPRLTDVLMETLAIVAYKQPVTRLEVEKIRGVNCDHALSRLVELGLIREAGRLDAPGRPILFATTESFLRYFGIRAAGELPEMDPVKMADLTGEAEREAGVQAVPAEAGPENSAPEAPAEEETAEDAREDPAETAQADRESH